MSMCVSKVRFVEVEVLSQFFALLTKLNQIVSPFMSQLFILFHNDDLLKQSIKHVIRCVQIENHSLQWSTENTKINELFCWFITEETINQISWIYDRNSNYLSDLLRKQMLTKILRPTCQLVTKRTETIAAITYIYLWTTLATIRRQILELSMPENAYYHHDMTTSSTSASIAYCLPLPL